MAYTIFPHRLTSAWYADIAWISLHGAHGRAHSSLGNIWGDAILLVILNPLWYPHNNSNQSYAWICYRYCTVIYMIYYINQYWVIRRYIFIFLTILNLYHIQIIYPVNLLILAYLINISPMYINSTFSTVLIYCVIFGAWK